MYLLTHRTIDIACSEERAFRYAADLENFPAWFPGVVALTSEDALPFATLGKAYREVVVLPMRGRRTVSIRVIDVEAPKRLVTEGTLPMLLPRMELDLSRIDADACRVTWRMQSRSESVLVRWLVLPWARYVLTRRADAGLRRLKALLER